MIDRNSKYRSNGMVSPRRPLRILGQAALGLFVLVFATGQGCPEWPTIPTDVLPYPPSGEPVPYPGDDLYYPPDDDMWAAEQAFYEQLESLPSIDVQIVNETSTTARIELVSGVAGPEFTEPPFIEDMPFDPYSFGMPPELELFLFEADFKMVSVLPDGTANGTLKCGEVMGISATVPADQEVFSGYGASSFGLFISDGNVTLTGIGIAGEQAFTGDIVGGARFVRPETDSVDCETQTLVITISGEDPITGTLSVE